jgi:hypothetical protein
MKTIITSCMLLLIVAVNAQDNSAYWVIERNVNKRDVTTVRFYSADHMLLQESVVQGKVIDINRAKHKKLLDQWLLNFMNKEPVSKRRHKSKSSV